MEKRNLLAIGLLLLTTTFMLCYYQWGRETEAVEPDHNEVQEVLLIQTALIEPEDSKESVAQKAEAVVPEQKVVQEDRKAKDNVSTENEQQSDDITKEPETKLGVVNTNALNVRKHPQKDADIVLIIERDTQFEVLDTYEDGWTKIEFEGKTGYVYSEYITVK